MDQKPSKKSLNKLKVDDFTLYLIGVVVVVLTIVILVVLKRRKTSRNGVLFTGLCDSGKTLTFFQLIYGKFIQTHTSISENSGGFSTTKGQLNVVDIPGHERLRNKFFDKHKSLAKGIVFVVDSLTIQGDIRDAAEYLYNILTDSVVTSNSPKLLILCNKQDQSLAKGCNVVRAIFEKELNMLRVTKSNQLQSVDPKAKETQVLGGDSKEFSFENAPIKTEFVEGFACNKDGSCNIDALQNWLFSL